MNSALIPKKETQQIITNAELQEIRKHVEESIYSSPLVKRIPEVQDYINKLFSIPVQKYAIDRIRKQRNDEEYEYEATDYQMVRSIFRSFAFFGGVYISNGKNMSESLLKRFKRTVQ